MGNRETYNDKFMQIFDVDESALGDGFTVKDVEAWDSMTHIQLISELEDAFDIMFDPDDIIEFDSYEKGIEILKKYEIEL